MYATWTSKHGDVDFTSKLLCITNKESDLTKINLRQQATYKTW